MARVFAPRILFQNNRPLANQLSGFESRGVFLTAQRRAPLLEPWFSYYSAVQHYEKSVVEGWCAGYTIPWQRLFTGRTGKKKSGKWVSRARSSHALIGGGGYL